MKSAAILAVLFLCVASGARADDAKPLLLAKITVGQAQAIALKVRPGRIVETDLERGNIGSGLRYAFDIKGTDTHVYGVDVDAITGAVLTNALERRN